MELRPGSSGGRGQLGDKPFRFLTHEMPGRNLKLTQGEVVLSCQRRLSDKLIE
jgi:hypothetical protein